MAETPRRALSSVERLRAAMNSNHSIPSPPPPVSSPFSQTSSTPTLPVDEEGLDGLTFEQIEASVCNGPGLPASAAITVPDQMFTIEDGRALKKFKTLSPDSEREYDEFLKSLHKGPAEAFARLMLVHLESRDLLRQSVQDNKSKWTVGPDLAKTLRNMAHIAILSPNIYAYKAKNLGKVVIKTMRLIGADDLPPEHETGRISLCTKTVTKQLTSSRYEIKLALGQSLYNGTGKLRSKPVDIGSLVHTLIGETDAPASAALHFRVAWLRSVWKDLFESQRQQSKEPGVEQLDGNGSDRSSEGANEEDEPVESTLGKRGRGAANASKGNQLKEDLDFWGIVDKELKAMREAFNTPELLARAFKTAYEEDIKAYGKAGTALEEAADIGEWLRSLHSATADKTLLAGGEVSE